MDISEEAISENRAYVFINKQVERVSKEAVEELDSKEVILIFPSQRKNNKTVRVLKTPKTDTGERKVYIPGFVAQCLIDIKKEQDRVSSPTNETRYFFFDARRTFLLAWSSLYSATTYRKSFSVILSFL